jgi:hypothetical protein
MHRGAVPVFLVIEEAIEGAVKNAAHTAIALERGLMKAMQSKDMLSCARKIRSAEFLPAMGRCSFWSAPLGGSCIVSSSLLYFNFRLEGKSSPSLPSQHITFPPIRPSDAHQPKT